MANSLNERNSIYSFPQPGRPKSDSSKSSRANYRLQVKLTKEGRERLDELLSNSHHLTAADLVRDSLRIYEILLESQANGSKILIENEDGSNETLIL